MGNVQDQLRQWARGSYPLEAGVELLIRGGKAIYNGAPWIVVEGDRAWVDVALLVDEAGAWSGGERRLTLIAASLLDPEQTVNLHETVTGLDRHAAQLVLAAVAHANGSHDHAEVSADGSLVVPITRSSSLHPWPS